MKSQSIQIDLTNERKEKPPADQLAFGKVYTDHMFVMDYTEGHGWHDARIVPYQPFTIDPAAVVFHYGQTIFEGLKAYAGDNGKVRLFRPEQNMARLNRSAERMCMPQIDEEFALEALKELLRIEKDWVPTAEGTSLYIRPFMIATEPTLSVDAAKSYKFMIILSPVGSYYKEGIDPVKILVENEYVRAVFGGTGTAKTAGNYAASLKAQEQASELGYSQVLWLDGVEKKYVEEVGSMNIFFKINGEIVTPALNGSILHGITRDSILKLLKHWDVPVSERRISMEELKQASDNGTLEEVFGAGTAAVITPVGEMKWEEENIIINDRKTGEISKKVYDNITGIQLGKLEDPFGWIIEVE